MKFFLFSLIACLTLSSQTHAQTSEWHLGATLDYWAFDSDRQIKNTVGGSLFLGMPLAENWLGEGALGWASTETDVGSTNVDLAYARADFLYPIHRRESFTTYFVTGLGYIDGTDINGTDNEGTTANLGLILQHHLSEHFAWRASYRWMHHFDEQFNDSIFQIGLVTFLGNKSQPMTAPQPQVDTPKDSDNDGVFDAQDKCPATPKDVTVDAMGCALDSDKDGVLNTMDDCPNTPMGAKVDSKGCRIILKETVTIRMNVKFASNSADVEATELGEIDKVAEFMKSYPDTKAIISGHTDSSGAAAYNKVLSEKRAKAVMNVLVKQYSIDAARLSAVGFGEEKPIASNATAEGKRENRRVEAQISATREKR